MMMHNPCHPGEILKESFMQPLNLTVTETARRLGVTRKTVSDLINEKSGVSTEMAYKLSEACDTTALFWVNLQKQYDLWQYRKTDLSKIMKLAG